jgi:hypothetical protein
MTMMPTVMQMPPCANENQKGIMPKVVKPRNAKCETASQLKSAKKQDLKNRKQAASVPTKGLTTLMLKGIPCRFSQESLMALIDDAGFKGKYDFFYLPKDGKRSANLGYAFMNFEDQHSAELFTANFQGVALAPDRSMKICTIAPADIQGLQNLRKHFCCTAVSRGSNGPAFPKVGEKHCNRKHAVSQDFEARRRVARD